MVAIRGLQTQSRIPPSHEQMNAPMPAPRLAPTNAAKAPAIEPPTQAPATAQSNPESASWRTTRRRRQAMLVNMGGPWLTALTIAALRLIPGAGCLNLEIQRPATPTSDEAKLLFLSPASSVSLPAMSHPVRAAGSIGLLAWAFSGLLHAESASTSFQPPSSLAPPAEAVSIRVAHRHRTVQDCIESKTPLVCTGREVDADTATVVRLTRTGVVSAAVGPKREDIQVSFPHHVGPQEQSIKLKPGDWLVDWPGAPTIGRLHVAAGANPQVTLVTTTGGCRFKEQRCELVTKNRQRMEIRDDKR